MQYVAPVLAYGCWAWLWVSATHSRANSTVHIMARCLLGTKREEEEDWLAYRTRTLRVAREFVKSSLGYTYADHLLVPAARKWEAWAWAARDEATHL